MKTVTLSDAQIDALVIAAHALMDGRYEDTTLEDAVSALLRDKDAAAAPNQTPLATPGRAA